MRRKLLTVLLVTAIVMSTLFAANINVAKAAEITDETGWVAAYPNNNQNDYIEDQQTGSGTVSQDIVGTASDPSTYMRFSASEVDFRIRLNDIDGSGTDYEFKNFAFIGIDSDLDGGIDLFLGIYNPTGNNGRLGIYESVDGYPNISPSTTGIEGKPLMAYEPKAGVNYTLTPAGTSIDGDDDYFISFKFSLDDIAEALQGTGISFTSSTPFRFMTGTAAQDNSFNQDLNGMDGSGWSSDDTWEDLGVFSDVVSPDGSANYHIVTFDRNTGDTEASPQIKAVEDGTALGALPSNPTKRGMYFQEWNTMPDGSGETITADTIINADVTAYAIWSNVPLMTVTFDTGAGTWVDGTTTQLTVNTINGIVDGNMPAEPINGSKNFVGWQIASGEFLNEQTLVQNASTYNSSTMNLLVTAVYANGTNLAAFYNNFDATGGDLVAKIYSNGASSNFNGVAPTISRVGYAFGGWYLNDMDCLPASTNIAAGATIPSAGNYYAKWTPVTYNVTFNQNYVGAPADTTQPAPGGVVGTMPAEPTRTGYEFIEWNRLTDATGEAIYPTTEITEDTTVYAIWKEIINVNFHSNTGTFDGGATTWTTTAVDNRLTLLPQPPSRTGYTFLGWSAAANVPPAVDLFNTDYDTVRNLYAIWAQDYTVTFNENYGDPAATKEVPTAYERVIYIPDDPTRTGYNFVEWTEEQAGGTEFLISTPVTKNEVVYAQWNATPDAVDDAAVTPTDTPVIISVLTNDTDPEGDTLSVVSTTASTLGATILINGDGTITYTPPAGVSGVDTFTYTVSDGNGGEDTATVTVYVNTNAPPTALDDAYTTDEDTAIVISDSLLGVLANDGDIDGTISLQSNTNPTHGTLALNADGTFTYTPDAGYNGTDSFTYTIVDDDSDTATATVNLTINSVNDTPSAVDDSYSTDQDVTLNVPALTGVLSNDTIGDGLKSIAVTTNVSHGTLTLNADGSFEYIPTPGYFGADEFTYTITDNDDETATATVSIAVHSTAVYNITYDANGGSNAPTDGTDYQAGETVTIAATEPTYTGYTFAGWTTNFDGNTYDKDDATYYEFTMPAQDVTLTAAWTANTDTAYKVEHYQEDVSGGTYTIVAGDTENLTGTTGATAIATANTYTGFTYNSGASTASGTIAADGSLVLKLYYDRNSHSLGYDSDGGDSTPTGGTYVYGETVTVATSVTKAGYTFGGWNDGSNTYAAGASYTMPDANVTLTAVWTAATDTAYKVEHYQEDVSGGTYTIVAGDTENLTGTTGATATATANTYTGFTYNSGASTASGTIAADGSLVVKLYYDRNSHSLGYDSDGGDSTPTGGTYVYGETVTVATSVTKAGYTFGGWNDGSNTYAAGASYTMPDANVTLTAVWTAATDTAYKVEHYQYDLSSNSYIIVAGDTENLTGTTGAAVSGTPKSYVGFTFSDLEGNPSGTILADGSLVLKLYYYRNSYNVTYDADGGAPTPFQIAYLYGETVTVGPAAAKEGYTFGGWNDGTTTRAPGSTFTMPDEPVDLTAEWTPATDTAYKVEHYQQNANDSNYTLADTDNLTGTTGDSVTATAKTYANFYENMVHADRVESGTILADGTLVLKLFYDRDSYFVGYDSDGGDTQPSPASYLYGQTVTVEAATTKTGYTFDGWSDGTTTRSPGATFIMPAQNVTLTAQWTANNYDVTYDAGAAGTNAASMPATSSHATDSLVIISSTEPTWTDHAFTGWLYNGTTYKRDGLDQFVMPAGAVTLTAQWDDVKYGVTYDGNDADSGVPSDLGTYLVGEDVVAGSAPVRSGYEFGGWSDGSTTYLPGANIPMVSGGLTLTAVWNEEYSVTYEAPDNDTGTVPSDSGVYISGDTVDIQSDEPARAGYTFDGWTKSGDTTVYKFGTSDDSFIMPAGDVTLTAQWTAIDYNVTYDDNDGDPATLPPTDSNNYNVGSSVTLADAPLLDGYTFDGWYDGSNTYAAGASYTMPADDVTFTAQWTLTEYTVILDKQSGTGGTDSVGVSYNNPMPTATPPTRDGFEFDGYYSEPDGAGTKYYNNDMTSANNWDKYEGGTLYANWIPLSTGLEVTPECSIINVGEDVTLTAEFTPQGSSHDPVVWTSSDPAIASVDQSTGVVTGLNVGRVVITATSGTLSDTGLVEVRSATPDDPSARTIVVEGDIFYTTDETPIPGIEMTLYSTPIRGTSNSAGYFYLGNTTEGMHTLTAEVTPGSEIGRIVPVTFTRGATESYVINADGSVSVTFTDTTDRIYLRLVIPRATGVLGVRDVRFSGYEATPAVNPPTGDDSTWLESAMDWIKDILD